MRKVFLTILFATVLFLSSRISLAQKYFVPDPAFRNFLITNYPFCMDGDSLITDSVTLAPVTMLEVNNLNISDLSGIEYFTSLNELNCSVNNLTTIAALPQSLTHLYCYSNMLSALPLLPPKLVTLDCGNNILSQLPDLPNTIRELDCQHNLISSFSSLPDSMHTFLCGDNILNSLPSLPQKLLYFSCYFNNINILPALPDSLMYLHCGLNGISMLPNSLPSHLLELECNYNYVSTLPPLPASLQSLSFVYNKVSAVPAINSELMILKCEGNKLDFSDIVPLMSVPSITYSPQDSIGISKYDTVSTGSNYSVVSPGYNSFNTYTWFKNNVVLTPDVHINLTYDSLVITSALLADSGIYNCSITNTKVPGLTLYQRKIHLAVVQNTTTGIATILPAEFSVYPSPASDMITIRNQSLASVRAQLINTLGEVLWEGDINSNSDKKLEIGQFEKGLYVLNLTSGTVIISKKVIFE